MGLDMVELLVNVEETFPVTIEERDAATVRTAGDLERVVLHQLETIGKRERSDAEVWTALQTIIGHSFAVPPHSIERTTRFIEDLGAD